MKIFLCVLFFNFLYPVYIKVLLAKLEEYSELNKPEKVKEQQKIYDELVAARLKEKVCDCNLFERLDINDELKRGLISEEEQVQKINNLMSRLS